MMNFATIDDVFALWRPLTKSEEERAEALLPIVQDSLRTAAKHTGRDLDRMVGGCKPFECSKVRYR